MASYMDTPTILAPSTKRSRSDHGTKCVYNNNEDKDEDDIWYC